MRSRIVFLLLWGVSFVTHLAGAEQTTPRVEVFRWKMTPAAAAPLLGQVSLTYHDDALRHENAAVFYGKALLMLAEARATAGKDAAWEQDLDKQLTAPLEELKSSPVLSALKPLQHVFRYTDYAAQCRTCDWQHPLDRENPYGIMLPELGQLRQLARLLALKARGEIAAGELDAARATLRSGYALTRHLARGSFLIELLVGAAIHSILTPQLEALLQQPDAPNLFWELAALRPIPYRLRDALQSESQWSERAFPAVKILRDGPVDAPRALQLAQQLIHEFDMFVDVDENGAKVNWESWLALVQGLSDNGAYRRRLIDRGRDAQQVQAMSAVQVVIVDRFEVAQELSQRVAQTAGLPFPQATRELQAIEQELQRLKQDAIPSMFLAMIPATLSMRQTLIRSERRLAALQAIEAHRSRDAALKALAPVDPVTGQPFVMTMTGQGLILDVPAIGKPATGADQPWRFEVEWRK